MLTNKSNVDLIEWNIVRSSEAYDTFNLIKGGEGADVGLREVLIVNGDEHIRLGDVAKLRTRSAKA